MCGKSSLTQAPAFACRANLKTDPASGSVAVDRREAAGLAAALGRRAAEVPVAAVKSMLGEAMGASGALQAVATLGTLHDGVIPGILGLESREESFPLAGALAAPRRAEVRRALVTAVGADGHCCALVLGVADALGAAA